MPTVACTMDELKVYTTPIIARIGGVLLENSQQCCVSLTKYISTVI